MLFLLAVGHCDGEAKKKNDDDDDDDDYYIHTATYDALSCTLYQLFMPTPARLTTSKNQPTNQIMLLK